MLLAGTLHVDQNSLRTTVVVDAPGTNVGGGAEEVVIDGWFARNRALNGDKVAVKLLGKYSQKPML